MSEPLFDLDAENAVLCILLNSPELAFEELNLKPSMFDSTINKMIFGTIKELASEGVIPDVSVLVGRLVSSNKIATTNEKDYISYLREQGFHKENLREFCLQVNNNYKIRSLIKILSIDKNSIPRNDVDAVLNTIRDEIDNLSTSASTEVTSDMDSILSTSWKKIIEKTENPGIIGVPTGIKDLDLTTGGIVGGEEWIIGARPSMGKTASLCNMVLNTTKLDNPVLAFSLEMNKQAMSERLIAVESGVNLSSIRQGTMNQEQLDMISDSVKVIKKLPIYLSCIFTPDLSYILNTARKYVKTKGVKLILLDYLQLLSGDDDDQVRELGRYSRAFKLLAEELGIGVILYSQLNRLVELRENKRPILSDLRQSGNLEQDADLALFLYRDELYYDNSTHKGEMEILIRKNRNGPIGLIVTKFNPENNRINKG